MTNLPAAAPAPLPGFVPRDRTLLMGVLNVTPDSFSDGGRWDTTDLAVAHGRQLLAQGADIVLEIDWQGAAQVQALYPEAVSVFIAPPSLEVLQQRLQTRGKDSAATIERRLAAARSELAHAGQFQYIIINQDFELARQQLIGIADTARCRFLQQAALNTPLFQSLGIL